MNTCDFLYELISQCSALLMNYKNCSIYILKNKRRKSQINKCTSELAVESYIRTGTRTDTLTSLDL